MASITVIGWQSTTSSFNVLFFEIFVLRFFSKIMTQHRIVAAIIVSVTVIMAVSIGLKLTKRNTSESENRIWTSSIRRRGERSENAFGTGERVRKKRHLKTNAL
jgi:hypothetical protein